VQDVHALPAGPPWKSDRVPSRVASERAQPSAAAERQPDQLEARHGLEPFEESLEVPRRPGSGLAER
jgi:hypothetical protein